MISEKEVAEKFTAVWKDSLPMLTSNFVRVFNESHVTKFGAPIVITSPSNALIISEFAFLMAKEIKTQAIEIQDAFKSAELIERCLGSANKLASRNHPDADAITKIKGSELDESQQLAENIIGFANHYGDDIEFSPQLKGYGALGKCEADISIGDTLFEIKTVNRTFRAKDLKQLFLYLALQFVTGKKRWTNAGLYNPRKNLYCEFSIEGLIGSLSGGRHSGVVFRNLLNSITRDVQVEGRF